MINIIAYLEAEEVSHSFGISQINNCDTWTRFRKDITVMALKYKKWEELLADFPPLWNPEDLHFRDSKVKAQCMQALLKKCNHHSSFPFTMESLKRHLKNLSNRRSYLKRLAKMNSANTPGTSENLMSSLLQAPVLDITGMEEAFGFTRQASQSQMEMPSSTMATLTTPTPSSSRWKSLDTPLTRLGTQAVREISGTRQAPPKSQTASPTSTTPNIQSVMGDTHTLEKLLAEYPCLWDLQDVNYKEPVARAQSQEQLLVKYNSISSIPITMEQLRQTLALSIGSSALDKLRQGAKEGENTENTQGTSGNEAIEPETSDKWTCDLEKLVTEDPYFWDPEEKNIRKLPSKDKCWEELLDKYNSLSSEPIQLWQLKRKIDALRVRLKRRAAKPANQALVQKISSDQDSSASFLTSSETSSDSTDTVNQIQHSIVQNNSNQIQLGNVQNNSNQIQYPIVQNNSNQIQSTNIQYNSNQQTGLYRIVFHCCAVCREVKSDCLNATDESYIKNNKTALAMNDLSIDLNIHKGATVCQQCDKKLKDTYDFINFVKNAQDNMKRINIVDKMTTDDDEDRKSIDFLTVTDTEVNTKGLHKRKGVQGSGQAPEPKKKFKVTIDLNASNDGNAMEDIEAKYQMFKKDDSLTKSLSANDVSEVAVTGNSEVEIKKEFETDDIPENNHETGEILAMDDIEAKYRFFQNKDDVSHAKSKKSDELSKVTNIENDIHKEVNETGETVNKDGNKNDAVSEEILDSVKTNKTVDIVSGLLSTSEPVCVMPQSELVQLVESIVSRMLNK